MEPFVVTKTNFPEHSAGTDVWPRQSFSKDLNRKAGSRNVAVPRPKPRSEKQRLPPRAQTHVRREWSGELRSPAFCGTDARDRPGSYAIVASLMLRGINGRTGQLTSALGGRNPDDAVAVLRRVHAYPAFRGQQADVVGHVIAGGHAVVLLPTGAGKSLCFHIPALCRDGVGIVVSLLIALSTNI